MTTRQADKLIKSGESFVGVIVSRDRYNITVKIDGYGLAIVDRGDCKVLS